MSQVLIPTNKKDERNLLERSRLAFCLGYSRLYYYHIGSQDDIFAEQFE
jgi:hypothetical protein